MIIFMRRFLPSFPQRVLCHFLDSSFTEPSSPCDEDNKAHKSSPVSSKPTGQHVPDTAEVRGCPDSKHWLPFGYSGGLGIVT